VLTRTPRGSAQRFCTPACRQAAYRRRRAHVAEDTPPQRHGGRDRHLNPSPQTPEPDKTVTPGPVRVYTGIATGGASNGGTQAVNGLIELHRRISRGFRNRGNYRLRMLLIGGGLSHPNLA